MCPPGPTSRPSRSLASAACRRLDRFVNSNNGIDHRRCHPVLRGSEPCSRKHLARVDAGANDALKYQNRHEGDMPDCMGGYRTASSRLPPGADRGLAKVCATLATTTSRARSTRSGSTISSPGHPRRGPGGGLGAGTVPFASSKGLTARRIQEIAERLAVRTGAGARRCARRLLDDLAGQSSRAGSGMRR